MSTVTKTVEVPQLLQDFAEKHGKTVILVSDVPVADMGNGRYVFEVSGRLKTVPSIYANSCEAIVWYSKDFEIRTGIILFDVHPRMEGTAKRVCTGETIFEPYVLQTGSVSCSGGTLQRQQSAKQSCEQDLTDLQKGTQAAQQ